MSPIILASRSPRRKQLLEWAAVPFTVVVQDTDESYPAGLPAREVAVFIARNKALAVEQLVGSKETILAADTIVVLGDRIIGKPRDREDAIAILTALSGKSHQVITGVVIRRNGQETSFADITQVHFHPLGIEQLTWYVDTYKPYDKAGAYAIQEWIGVVGIRSVEGDFYNVMGLPVSRVVQALQALDS